MIINMVSYLKILLSFFLFISTLSPVQKNTKYFIILVRNDNIYTTNNISKIIHSLTSKIMINETISKILILNIKSSIKSYDNYIPFYTIALRLSYHISPRVPHLYEKYWCWQLNCITNDNYKPNNNWANGNNVNSSDILYSMPYYRHPNVLLKTIVLNSTPSLI